MEFTKEQHDRLALVKLFAHSRHGAFIRKMSPEADRLVPEKQVDPVLKSYKFTNVYRVLDRTSQGLIRMVNNDKKNGVDELDVAARIYAYKLFNRLDTWKRLPAHIAERPFHYREELFSWAENEVASYRPVFSRAYLLCTGKPRLPLYMGTMRKLFSRYRNVETLLESDNVWDRYSLLIQYPGFGEFLAYQFALDFSYYHCRMDAYDEFVMPGPGCMRGVTKVLGTPTNKDYAAGLCTYLATTNYFELQWRGYPLRGNDIQNIFCEFDKYSRVAYPSLDLGWNYPTRIKNKYVPNPEPYDIEWPLGWF